MDKDKDLMEEVETGTTETEKENEKVDNESAAEEKDIVSNEDEVNSIVNAKGVNVRADDTTDDTTDSDKLSTEQTMDASMAAMMYYQLNRLFGAGSQLFTMEYPGRTLNRLDYAYPIEDYNSSSLTKPYAVTENEFRLCDNMLDLCPIAQGPNGSNLSTVYNTVLNNFTPKINDLKDFITDKMELRMFLLEKITDQIDGETVTCSRLEFSQRVYMRYLEKKYNWDQEKIETQLKYNASNELDEYAKWLSTTAWTKDHELECLFNDAVVRGFYHEIMTILGFLDIASPSERLSTAKSNRRASARRSLDGSMEILPVQFQPSNWFRSLTPNFSPKDLTLGCEYLSIQYKSKKAQLSSMQAELRVLLAHNIGTQDLEKLEQQVKDLKESMVSDEKSYFKGYTDAQIESIKLAFEIVSNGDILGLLAGDLTSVMSLLKNLTSNKAFSELLGMAEGAFETLIGQTYKLYSAHLDYFKTFEELMDTELALASAKTNNYSDEIEILKERIKLLSQEVEQLGIILTSDAVNNSTDGTASASTENTDLLPVSKYNEDTEFTDIVFDSSEVKNLSETQKESTYGKLGGSLGNLFFNSSSNMEYSASKSKFVQNMYDENFTIGMRVTKVTVDRGGWFDPAICDISGSYMRVNKKILWGAGLTPDKIMEAFNSGDNKYDNGEYSAILNLITKSDGSRYVLPAYPTSFIIVKDMVIKSVMANFSKEDYEEFRKMAMQTTTHIFGIKLSGGYTTESYMGYTQSTDGKTTFYMRIPGPQILGWFMELSAQDNSIEYESLSKSEYFNEIIDSLKTYREKLDGLNGNGEAVKVEIHNMTD